MKNRSKTALQIAQLKESYEAGSWSGVVRPNRKKPIESTPIFGGIQPVKQANGKPIDRQQSLF